MTREGVADPLCFQYDSQSYCRLRPSENFVCVQFQDRSQILELVAQQLPDVEGVRVVAIEELLGQNLIRSVSRVVGIPEHILRPVLANGNCRHAR